MDKYEFGNREAHIVLIQPVDDYDLAGIENEFRTIRETTGADLRLVAAKVRDWNVDLSPWEAPAVFGNEKFGSGAPDTLEELLELTGAQGKTYYLGGYSLAGLFALCVCVVSGIHKLCKKLETALQRRISQPGRQGRKDQKPGDGNGRRPDPGTV